jgi:NTE family protein
LFDAIRASIAIPTIFTPHQYRGRQFLDGSLTNPIPVAPTIEDRTGLTIAVNLSGAATPAVKLKAVRAAPENHLRPNRQQRIVQFVDDLKRRLEWQSEDTLGMLDIIIKAMSIMESSLAQTQLKTYAPDVVIDIPKNACNFFEFYRARELIEIGRRRTEAVLSQYSNLNA